MKDNSNYEIIENDAELEKLCTDSVELINYARNIVVKHVNIVQIMTYYSLGRWIVETQQMGEKRAKYGSKVIKTLSENLQKEFGKGFSEDTLKNARKFYLTYKERISETVFSLFAIEKSETVFSFFEKEPPFIVSWSHYLQLMRIENEAERSFYEIETAKTGWGVRTLQRQYNSSLYERLALSRDKEGVLRLASEGNVITKPEDIIKQPTVLEFLGMEEKAKYSETDLETALINKLQKFLLELGKGYLFEARQKRFTYDEDNFYVDLVFYNRLLRCYVLIDLKVDKLTHQDIGQMQMYVNYYDRYEKLEDENPTIGILLCKEKNDALVEITLPKDANIYASEYFYFMRAFSKDNIFTSVEKMSEEAKKIFEGISKHSDLAFNQAKMAVDKISVFDQHQILDGLYQDVISDDSYEKEKVRFFLLWGALNEQLQENTIKYCTDLSAQKISVSQIPYFEGFYAQCKNKGASIVDI